MAARIKAVAVVQGQANIRGIVTFEELQRQSTRYVGNKYTVRVVVDVHGLPPGKHAFHIHQAGDLRHGCDSLCDHFNPDRKVHGGRNGKQRHAGDLGNILADQSGHVYETFTDNTIQLRNTKYNIIGRSVVIHQDGDDLGRGGDRESLLTGNAGARIACGVIGYAMC